MGVSDVTTALEAFSHYSTFFFLLNILWKPSVEMVGIKLQGANSLLASPPSMHACACAHTHTLDCYVNEH